MLRKLNISKEFEGSTNENFDMLFEENAESEIQEVSQIKSSFQEWKFWSL